MAKPKETFNKKEKEQKKRKQRQAKAEKMEQRKAAPKKEKTLEEMMVYIDENGNFTNTPPDPRKRRVINSEDMIISTPKQVPMEYEVKTGTITFFNSAKGFGFITDAVSGERIFLHVNNLTQEVKEMDKVQFDVESGARGLSAINVVKIK